MSYTYISYTYMSYTYMSYTYMSYTCVCTCVYVIYIAVSVRICRIFSLCMAPRASGPGSRCRCAGSYQTWRRESCLLTTYWSESTKKTGLAPCESEFPFPGSLTSCTPYMSYTCTYINVRDIPPHTTTRVRCPPVPRRAGHVCFRVLGFGFRVSDFGFWVSGFGFRISGFGFWVSGFGFQVLGLGFQVSDTGFGV